MCDYSLKIEVSHLVGVGFMRSLKMQLWLFECALTDWLSYVFCMMRIMFGRGVISMDRYCGLLPISNMRRKTFCIVRKGEKQIQILDGY
jgi:hypothetical protein